MNTKAVIFDYDGTLTQCKNQTSSWSRVWELLDDIETDEKFYNMYSSGQIDLNQWLVLIKNRFIEKGLDYSVCKTLANQTKLLKNINSVFKKLHENNIKIYILSGGIKNIIELTLLSCKDYITSIEGYYFEFKQNKFVDVLQPQHDLESKNEFVNLVIKENNLNPSQVLFVGNGKNDETVYQTGARTLCINPDDADYKNKTKWHNTLIKCNDLKEILPFVNYKQDLELNL